MRTLFSTERKTERNFFKTEVTLSKAAHNDAVIGERVLVIEMGNNKLEKRTHLSHQKVTTAMNFECSQLRAPERKD